MGSRSATTSPTGSVHSTPTHQTKPNTLDPFADIGNLGGSFGGQWRFYVLPEHFRRRHHLIISLLSLSRFWLLKQTHYSNWIYPLCPSYGLPIAASSISPACRLPLLAARCRKWWRVAASRTGPSPTAKAQPQPQPHASHVAPKPTQLQCQLLCNGRRLT